LIESELDRIAREKQKLAEAAEEKALAEARKRIARKAAAPAVIQKKAAGGGSTLEECFAEADRGFREARKKREADPFAAVDAQRRHKMGYLISAPCSEMVTVRYK